MADPGVWDTGIRSITAEYQESHMAQEMRSPIESGCPDGFQYMHPVMRKNYGQWAYHEDPRPGVLVHVAHSGDKIWTVRAGTQRILDIFTLRELCDIGDKYGEGY